MDMQKLVDALGEAGRMERSRYHLTLGAAIRELSEIAPSTKATFDILGTPGKVASYRGYYSDLAFRTNMEPVTVGDVLAELKSALGKTFEGYKGGDYLMTEGTPLWVSEHGECSDRAVMGVEMRDGFAVLLTRLVRD